MLVANLRGIKRTRAKNLHRAPAPAPHQAGLQLGQVFLGGPGQIVGVREEQRGHLDDPLRQLLRQLRALAEQALATQRLPRGVQRRLDQLQRAGEIVPGIEQGELLTHQTRHALAVAQPRHGLDDLLPVGLVESDVYLHSHDADKNCYTFVANQTESL